jgi:hypothetical protein
MLGRQKETNIKMAEASEGENANKLDKIQEERLWEDRNSGHGTAKGRPTKVKMSMMMIMNTEQSSTLLIPSLIIT